MMEERFKPLAPDQMTPEQRHTAEQILAGPRKTLRGPFQVLLRSPELGDRVQRVGEFVRFENSLPARLRELAILVTARFWTAQYEWYAHRKLALEAGLAPAICDALALRQQPSGMASDEMIVHAFASELLESKEVSDATFEAMAERFGERGIVDLIGTIGYYCIVSMALNVGRYPLPPDATPLPPLRT